MVRWLLSFLCLDGHLYGRSHPQPVPNALAVNSTALLSVCLFFPVAGALSDRFGRRRVMTIGGVGIGVLSPLLIMFMAVVIRYSFCYK
jgi:MFS family permease